MKFNLFSKNITRWSFAYTAFCGLVSFLISLSNLIANLKVNISADILDTICKILWDFVGVSIFFSGVHITIAATALIFTLLMFSTYKFFAKIFKKEAYENVFLYILGFAAPLSYICYYDYFSLMLIQPLSKVGEAGAIVMFLAAFSFILAVALLWVPALILLIVERNPNFRVNNQALIQNKYYKKYAPVFFIFIILTQAVPLIAITSYFIIGLFQ